MSGVNKTMYIPLYGKALVSSKGLFLSDKCAENIWSSEGFSLNGKAKSKWLAYYMGIRAAVFDEWVKARIEDAENPVILHIGCGMDSRALRVAHDGITWYDVDFPDVIEERRRYYTECDGYKMIGADARDTDWLSSIKEVGTAIVVMEGVSMYLSTEDMRRLTESLCTHFKSVKLLVDAYTTFAAKISKRTNPIHDVGVTEVYGIDNPKDYLCECLSFVKEHTMIPKKYIYELAGLQRVVFARLYAGKISKKLYRLFEYIK